MFERFSKSLLGLFGAGRPKAAAKPASARDRAVAEIRRNQDKVMTPQRAELIRNAMEVHRAKKAILDDLDDEQKQKLVAMALRAFLNEGREGAAQDKASGTKPSGKSLGKGAGKGAGNGAAKAPTKAKKGR